ncbi:hypothetical protein ElyMa_005545900 [Elysia marginata]|uniref:Uncharacterized protein n=1 Tax=Elysia marginata TaxID=1093978 RepID=A0AAV4EZ60_9GAST|nr:hypothetical protein ElyMa_005545900 [Elysia marginata]
MTRQVSSNLGRSRQLSLASAFPVVSTVSGLHLYAIVQYAARGSRARRRTHFPQRRSSSINKFRGDPGRQDLTTDISTNTPGACTGEQTIVTQGQSNVSSQQSTQGSAAFCGIFPVVLVTTATTTTTTKTTTATKVIRGRASQQDNQLVYKQRSSAGNRSLVWREKRSFGVGERSVFTPFVQPVWPSLEVECAGCVGGPRKGGDRAAAA